MLIAAALIRLSVFECFFIIPNSALSTQNFIHGCSSITADF